MTILLVDDNVNDAKLVREVLVRQDSDITIIDAETCEDALRMSETALIDCIVMDEQLVRTPGSECVDRLRRHNYVGAFILLTGFPDTRTAVDAMMNGADNYLSKSDIHEGLLPAILKAVDKRRTLVRMQEDAIAKEKRYEEQRSLREMSPTLSEAVTDIRNLKEAVEALEVKVDGNNAKQFEMLLNLTARQDADRRWRFRQFMILLSGILAMLGKMFKDYMDAVYK